MNEPVADIEFKGTLEARAFRRGTYLGRDHLDSLIEQALGKRYSFGAGWRGYASVSIRLYDRPPDEAAVEASAEARAER